MDTKYKNLQRLLRNNMPAPELMLWQKIRREQLGVKFRRQYTIENRILDFYAPKIKLGIEIDGESHFSNLENREKELQKDKDFFIKHKIKILRFLNTEVIKNLEGVLNVTVKEITLALNPPS